MQGDKNIFEQGLLVTASSHQFKANWIVWTASDDQHLQAHFRRSTMFCNASGKPPEQPWLRFLQLGYAVVA
ncbi:hypothetical protein KXJ72_02845 [Comamonas aquatica]|nr:hypothetical protein KXJ72_02845 [Comamonas aquatica]